jgi:hypothetical protein
MPTMAAEPTSQAKLLRSLYGIMTGIEVRPSPHAPLRP